MHHLRGRLLLTNIDSAPPVPHVKIPKSSHPETTGISIYYLQNLNPRSGTKLTDSFRQLVRHKSVMQNKSP